MRNFLFGLTVLCALFTYSCTKDDTSSDNLNNASASSRNIENSGTWFVTHFSEGTTIQTSLFANYAFQFLSNGVITGSTINETITGTWRAVADSGKSKIVISFPAINSFNELSEDWELIEESGAVIKLKHISGGNGGDDILEFGRSQVAGNINIGSTPLQNISGKWSVSKYQNKDKDRTSYFTGYGFEFKTGGDIIAAKGTSIINGTWKSYVDSGKSKLKFTFPDVNKFGELNEDWEIISQSATTLNLKNVSGGNGGTSNLSFSK